MLEHFTCRYPCDKTAWRPVICSIKKMWGAPSCWGRRKLLSARRICVCGPTVLLPPPHQTHRTLTWSNISWQETRLIDSPSHTSSSSWQLYVHLFVALSLRRPPSTLRAFSQSRSAVFFQSPSEVWHKGIKSRDNITLSIQILTLIWSLFHFNSFASHWQVDYREAVFLNVSIDQVSDGTWRESHRHITFSRRFCPKWITVFHTLMVLAAMWGADHIRSSLSVSMLHKDTSTCRPGESNQRPSNNKTLALTSEPQLHITSLWERNHIICSFPSSNVWDRWSRHEIII